MPKITRRNLLAKTGAGVAAAGVITTTPGLLKATGTSTRNNVRKQAQSASAQQSVRPAPNFERTPSVVYIRDAAKGEVVLMVGSREIVRIDPQLVDYLTRSANA
jgi:high-affinity K+ transport system ATPase subunit B